MSRKDRRRAVKQAKNIHNTRKQVKGSNKVLIILGVVTVVFFLITVTMMK